jgi:3',5'-cyclic AMP phosphodiesterase CpdA
MSRPHSGPNLGLLQLSDIHFGTRFFKYSLSQNPDDWAKILADAVEACLDAHGMKDDTRGDARYQFDCLVLSGDLNSRCEEDGMTAATRFVEESKTRWWGAREVLVIPGNHDIGFGRKPDDSKNYVIPVRKQERERLYRSTYRNIVGRDELGDDWMGVLLTDDEQKTAIIGLDSCRVEGWAYPGIGFVGYDQVAEILQTLENRAPGERWRKLAFLHHHVLTPGKDDDQDQPRFSGAPAPSLYWQRKFTLLADQKSVREAAAEFGIDFLMHGHFHRADVHASVNSQKRAGRVISAGSPSVHGKECDDRHQFYVYEVTDGELPLMTVHDFHRRCAPTDTSDWEVKRHKFALTPKAPVPSPGTNNYVKMDRSRSHLMAFDSYPLAVGCLKSRGQSVDGLHKSYSTSERASTTCSIAPHVWYVPQITPAKVVSEMRISIPNCCDRRCTEAVAELPQVEARGFDCFVD